MKKKQKRKILKDVRVTYISKAVLVGIITGFLVSLFRLIIEILLGYTISVYHFLREEPQWIIGWVIISISIVIFIGKLIKSEPNIKGSGIPQLEGQLHGEIEVNWWSVLWKKFVGGILSISPGLFLGREGPSIQIGAVIGQGVNQLFKGERTGEKVLISSGASAGLAAAFNAPMAGLLFVLEEVHHNFFPLIGLTSLSAAITANFISLKFFGLTPVLDLGKLNIFPVESYIYLIILGVILGLFGLLYQKVLLALPNIYEKIKFLPSYLYGIVPFLLIIPIGLLSPEILGGGSEIILFLKDSSPTLIVLVGLFAIRFIFSMISYGGNLPGGIFLPILSLGAILGSIYGNIIVDVTGMDIIYIKSFIVFAMGGYFTAIGKAPLTAIVLVTEMIGSLNQLMPLAVVSLVAYIVVDLAGAKPIYEALLDVMLNKDESILKGKKEFIEISVEVGSILDGGMINDFKWPENALITSIRRGGNDIIILCNTMIHSGDYLIILTDEGFASEVGRHIKDMSQIKHNSEEDNIYLMDKAE